MRKFAAGLIAAALIIMCSGCAQDADTADRAEQEACSIAHRYEALLTGGAEMDEILTAMGADGYPAVDALGTLPFVNAEKLTAFVESQGEGSNVSFLRVETDGGLIYTRFYKDDTLRCRTLYITWDNTVPKITFTSDYAITSLSVTDKGYLIYTCDIPDNTAPSKHDGYIVPTTMLRLAPRAPEVAAFDKYVVPIGYNCNDLFTRTWTGETAENVCWNDVYLSLWRAEHGAYLYYFDDPYPKLADSTLSLVPKAEFEALITKYIAVSPEGIALYDDERGAYPIGVNRTHMSDSVPIPEVVKVAENADGTYTLTVDALFVEGATDRLFTHYVTLTPQEDGTLRISGNVCDTVEQNYTPLSW